MLEYCIMFARKKHTSKKPVVDALPLTLQIEKEIKLKTDSRKTQREREALKTQHTSRSTGLKNERKKALKTLRESKGTPEFNERLAQLSQIDHYLSETTRREFGPGKTYPAHPKKGDLYVRLSDLKDAKYADVLLRLLAGRISNSSTTRSLTRKPKQTNYDRVHKLVGPHKELIRTAKNSLTSGGRNTRRTQRTRPRH